MLLLCVVTLVATCCQHVRYSQHTVTVVETHVAASTTTRDPEQPTEEEDATLAAAQSGSQSAATNGDDTVDFTLS
jgi:hypothetical protein